MRSGLALMGFGFVVARFGLFLEQLQFSGTGAGTSPTGPSLWFGTALITAGVLVSLASAWRHIRLVRQLDRGQPECSRSLTLSVATGVFLAVVGLTMAIYLFSVRSSRSIHSGQVEERPMAATNHGLIDKPSNHSVDETVDRLKSILEAKGVRLFALVDHSGEAEKVGMKMRPTKLLIFGSPKAGTPLMLASPSMAIDLPLKILVWQDQKDKVWVSYNSPDYLRDRHGLPAELLQNIAVVETLATKAAE